MITIQQAIEAMKDFQKQDNVPDEDMVGILCEMFYADQLSLAEFKAMIYALGYELSDEFLNMSLEDQKIKLFNDD